MDTIKRYNVIQGEKISYLEVKSKSGKTYYLTPWINPLFTFIEFNDQHSTSSWKKALPYQILWTCTCADFQQGKARRGENPFENPCKHVQDMLNDTKSIRNKLEALLYADKGMAQGIEDEKEESPKNKKNETKARKNKEREERKAKKKKEKCDRDSHCEPLF